MEIEIIRPTTKGSVRRRIEVPSVTVREFYVQVLLDVVDHMKLDDDVASYPIEIARVKKNADGEELFAFRKVKEHTDLTHELAKRVRKRRGNERVIGYWAIFNSVFSELLRRSIENKNGPQISKSTRVHVELGKDEWDWNIITNKIVNLYG